MKKLLLPLLLLFIIKANAQLLSWTPDFIQESSTPITITMDATIKSWFIHHLMYMHIGVITNLSTSPSDWKYVKFPDSQYTLCCYTMYFSRNSNKWQYTITGSLRSYFGITNASETIKKIAILFRMVQKWRSKQQMLMASDMYVPVYDNGLYARIDVPFQQPLYKPIPEPITKYIGDPVAITARKQAKAAP